MDGMWYRGPTEAFTVEPFVVFEIAGESNQLHGFGFVRSVKHQYNPVLKREIPVALILGAVTGPDEYRDGFDEAGKPIKVLNPNWKLRKDVVRQAVEKYADQARAEDAKDADGPVTAVEDMDNDEDDGFDPDGVPVDGR